MESDAKTIQYVLVSDIGPGFNLKASKVFYGPQIRRFQIHQFQTKTVKEIRLICWKNRISGWYVSDIGPYFNLKASKVFYGPQIAGY
ncbi:MAG: hypothetical protein DRR08_03050 [Candidatus Parabeggiatoa sp. nov. 2]|nr:MAG: hypothetical protein B6247_09110 [Beggiatoa sp. 4572_84]RKZ63563.1 MAG: hypothetical protein DRR08_03050 [Gammaproteobacteria bacterium]